MSTQHSSDTHPYTLGSVKALCGSLACILMLGSLLLAGCGMTSAGGGANSGSEAQPYRSLSLNGHVIGGQNPILGATVQLYQVGTTGYSSAAKPLLATAATTNSGGTFTLTGQYTCTSGTYLYITAAGGSPQLSASPATVNNNITLGAVVGLCDNLTSSTFIQINEVTTVALAYSLAQFSSGTSFGTTQVSKPGSSLSAPADNFASSSTNTAGLANAMAISQVLASTATGSSPGMNSNASATAEWWQVNLIADILAACVNSAGGTAGDGSNCGTLFANVTASTAPVDTLQAAIALALTPTVSTASIGSLYGIIPASAPFQPYPKTASAITDFSIGIQYKPVSSGTTTLLNQPNAISFDSLGNAWVGNQPTSGGGVSALPGSIVELTPTGVPIQAGATAGTYAITSYTLSTGGSAVTIGGQYINTGTSTSPSYSVNGLYVPQIDTNNNVWFNDRYNSAIGVITGSGTSYSNTLSYTNGGGGANATGYALGTNSWPTATYVDGSNNVYFTLANLSSLQGGAGGPPSCTMGAQSYSAGLGVFVAGSNTHTFISGLDNAVNFGNQAYIVVDPNKTDTVSGTAIPGAPFVWTVGTNGTVNLLIQDYTSGSSASVTSTSPTCQTPLANIGWGLNASESGTNPGHTNSRVLDRVNPASSTDYLHFIGAATDWAFDKSGNIWIGNANQNINNSSSPINSAATIFSSISKTSPTYAASLSTTTPNNWAFSVYHNVAGMYDGTSSSSDYPSFLNTDGSGNVWFALSSNFYINAITNNGVALSPNTGATNNTMAGFAGSTCASCTYNGTTATYARPAQYTVSRPSIDQAGNVWVPYSGRGSTYLDVLVGIASPRVNPDSAGLKAGTFASIP